MRSDTEKKQKGRLVEVHYKDADEPLVYAKAKMTYIKGQFFCVHSNGYSYKHPIENIWRIREGW